MRGEWCGNQCVCAVVAAGSSQQQCGQKGQQFSADQEELLCEYTELFSFFVGHLPCVELSNQAPVVATL